MTSKTYYENNKEKVIKQVREYERKHPEKRKKWHKKYEVTHKDERRGHKLYKNYGLTLQDYDELYKSQDGRCVICGRHQSMFRKKLGVDHCHVKDFKSLPPQEKKKCIRGLLCVNCNRKLGLMERFNWRHAVQYLLDYETNYENKL